MKKVIIVIGLIAISAHCICQIRATTKEGLKAELSADGTWRYIDPDESVNISTEPCDCPYKYRIKEIEEYSRKNRKVLRSERIGTSSEGSSLRAFISQVGDFYGIYLVLHSNLGCMAPNSSTANFKFEDGTVIGLNHIGEQDCRDIMYFIGNATDYINIFRTTQLKEIHLTGTVGHSDITLDNGNYFITAFNCCIF